jgi:acyl-CoA synthetase (NDP forming)
MTVLENLLVGLLTFARKTGAQLAEFEINPLVVVRGDLVALDVLVRLETSRAPTLQLRPLHKLPNLLRPESIAIAGVSRRQNPGRVILENVLAEGFPSERVTILKQGVDQVAGCRAVASIGDLEAPVDLLVLAVSAEAVPDLVERAVRERKAESILLIPGGLGERGGSETHVEAIRETLAISRASNWQGPLMNGANCLGVRSVPGRYDTLFIPRHKLSFPARKSTPLALISQSGAFAVARASKLWSLSPRYVVSVGNQIDLTVGDYLTFLADDSEVEVFACYVEGFQPLDGARFLAAAEKIVASGRTVVLYRAGRSAAGIEAAVSHTAAVAGAYSVTRQLSAQSGILVAETIDEFEELTRVACLLAGRDVAGGRLGAMSNAGFESVAIADRLGRLQLVEYSTVTRARLGELIARLGLEKIVAIDNPLDTSPIFDDDSFVEAARAIVDDEGVDIAVIGCVPLTPALQTLAADAGHLEDVDADGSVASGLIRLWQQTKKPLVVVVDGGPMYETFARRLEAEGVPTFRAADRALEVLNSCFARRLERQ